jgi:uncharacterized protein (TIGR02680 family)
MTTERWVLNRAGVLNFWLYTDEVFELSEGRLIFRGANGSGKSVTMQSFLPLVLDGDKRPARLDPFGSRDRRIEYYLLGESDSGRNDQIGYLYLEFHQPITGKFLTIGIGLRARRGASQVGFWGFVITDQRRVGQDLFLYDRDLFEKHGEKLPLDRAELEKVIGAGGRVVREQGEYRQMVNQYLFGFANDESFKDLLELMIQLRSPKLSKEFKPSTIYGILHDALPPLSEEELRPLAEVLEDMDELGDRLEELRLHRNEAEKLVNIYNQYNEQRLFELSTKVCEAAKERQQKEREVQEESEHWQQQKAAKEQTEAYLHQSQLELAQREKEWDVLNRSEVMEKQRELQTEQERLQDVQGELRRSQQQLEENRHNLDRKEKRYAALQQEIHAHEQEQQELRMEMETLARNIEFSDHDIYDSCWQTAEEGDETALWNGWRNDVKRYRQELREAHTLCQEEREAHRRMGEAERHMSEARKVRDEKERVLQEKEEAMREAILRQEDALFQWFKGVQELAMTEEVWQEIDHCLHRYPEISYEEILAPAKHVWENARSKVLQEQWQIEHQIELQKQARDQLQQEWDAWKSKREPEPERSEARTRGRQRRQQATGEQRIGAPLYMLCDFRPEVDEATRARLEETLQRAGLLDAWVSPQPVDVREDEEEVWLRPRPVWLGYTLFDFLEPTPTAESGLTYQQVEEALRTILVGQGNEGEAYVTESGQFVLGPLWGQTAGKPRAEWIGAETRRQTRLAEMKRLEEALVAVSQEIARLIRQRDGLQERLTQMEKEWKQVPSAEPLLEAERALRYARDDLAHAQKMEAHAVKHYKEAESSWRERQQMVLERTAKWSRLKKEVDFREALDILDDYERNGTSLRSVRLILTQKQRDEKHLAEDIAALHDRLVEETEHQEQLRIREWQFQASVESLKKLVQEMGVFDLYQQLQTCSKEIKRLKQAIDEFNSSLRQLERDVGAAEERLRQRQAELQQREETLNLCIQGWLKEWGLHMVDFTDDPSLQSADVTSREGILRATRGVYNRLRSAYETRKRDTLENRLRDTFLFVKNILLDYSLEQRYDEAEGRIFIEALRDRRHPWTPAMLLKELQRMEEEQQLLLQEKDRELFEEILLRSVGRAIKERINRAEAWVKEMNRFMSERKTSSGLILSLEWTPRAARNERELDTEQLVRLLRKDPNTLLPEEVEQVVEHFRSRIRWAKQEAEEGESLRRWIQELLDYRGWFTFTLYYRKGNQSRRELTDSRFNVLSGGEKAMAMYIPLFAAVDSRYKDSQPTAPRIISLDEAFAGVDDENIRDMFQLLTEMKFDYMMTSQVLWGCYDTVPALSIYEIYRPLDSDVITVFPYYWNGRQRHFLIDGDWSAFKEIAVTQNEDRHRGGVEG